MVFYRGRRILVAFLATIAVAVAASLAGLAVGLFLAGLFGGGVLTAILITVRNRNQR